MIIVPIHAEERVLGALVLGHSAASKFTPNHLNLCIGVASQTGQAILNARHREDEAGVVVGVLADQVHAPRRRGDPAGVAAEAQGEGARGAIGEGTHRSFPRVHLHSQD